MKYMTLMIIPYPGADVRSMKISHRTLKILAVTFTLLASATVAFAIYLKPVFYKASRFESLVAENRELAKQNSKIVELQKKISAIDKMIGRIQVAQGVKPPQESDEKGLTAVMAQPVERQDHVPTEVLPEDYGSSEPQVLSTVAVPTDTSRTDIPFGMPIDEKSFISRTFNPKIYHYGVDFAIKQGTPVKSTADGTVTIAEKNDNLGYYIMIKHGNGFSTMYAHNSRLTVEKGARVRKGDLIAYSGNLGVSSGPHLHYAVFDENGNPVDPLPFLQH